jgi:hypothetical protein
MPGLKNEEAKTIDFRRKKPPGTSSRPVRRKTAAKRKRHKKKAGVAWQSVTLLCLCIILLITCGLSLYAFHFARTLSTEMTQMVETMGRKVQQLDAGINFDSKRQQLLLGIRDEIMEANTRIGLDEAYEYSSLILKATEKYPAVEPLMFLAMGVVESGYDRLATSQANARGLYQIWPSTARMLARARDWEYTDQMLYDPEINTELAALYLDILFSAYHDEKLVLAEYNGGPLNAGYLRAGSRKAAAETREYVAKVLDLRRRLRSKFERGNPVRLKLMHKDQNRNGKQLAHK